MKNRKATYLLASIILFISCSEKDFDSIPHGYFMYEYVNFAWGYQHSGWIIDSDGNVKGFDLPIEWNRPDSLGYISKKEIIENISNSNKEIDKVSKRKVHKYNKLLNNASNGQIINLNMKIYDAGKRQFYYFFYDENKGLYRKILLSSEGDLNCYNENDDAKRIVKWLRSIN